MEEFNCSISSSGKTLQPPWLLRGPPRGSTQQHAQTGQATRQSRAGKRPAPHRAGVNSWPYHWGRWVEARARFMAPSLTESEIPPSLQKTRPEEPSGEWSWFFLLIRNLKCAFLSTWKNSPSKEEISNWRKYYNKYLIVGCLVNILRYLLQSYNRQLLKSMFGKEYLLIWKMFMMVKEIIVLCSVI